MAKYKVLKTFRDKHTKEVYEKDSVIDITVKRADEVAKNLDGSFLERINEEAIVIKDGIDVEDMTVEQLKDVLNQLDVEYKSNAKKDDLISLLEKASKENDKKE